MPRTAWVLLNLAVLILAFAVRASCMVAWEEPEAVHHVDEQLLVYESLAIWEGVTPRELGWPAATTRGVLSLAYALTMVADWSSPFRDASMSPDLLAAVARWTRDRLDDPAPLFVVGRWVSIAIGTLQVLVSSWAGRRWVSPTAGAIAALACALSPLAVSYSQFILADMTGVLFATVLMGVLAPRAVRSMSRPFWAGVLVGLAGASKHHFLAWIVAVIADSIVYRRDRLPRGIVATLSGCAIAYLLLVPWALTNPLLIAKEFAGTILSKIHSVPSGPGDPLRSLRVATTGLGWLALVGLPPGLAVAWRTLRRSCLPMIAVLLAGLAAIAKTTEVYDRYGLLILPAVALFSAIGWAFPLTNRRVAVRIAAALLFLTAAGLDAGHVLWAQRRIGRLDSYGLAFHWLVRHMRPGAHIAVDSHFSRHIPLSRQDLEAQLSFRVGPVAYQAKMKSLGYPATTAEEPMRATILNDEMYTAHWLRRELSGRHPDEGFRVTLYHHEPRFNSISRNEAIARFLDDSIPPEDRVDALLLNLQIDLGIEPRRVFEGPMGYPLYLYLRDDRSREGHVLPGRGGGTTPRSQARRAR